MRLTGSKCQCTVCGLGLGSERAFDRHRVGDIGQPDRRCLTVAEMTAEGWVQDRRGFWLTPDPRRAGAAQLDASTPSPTLTHRAGADGRETGSPVEVRA